MALKFVSFIILCILIFLSLSSVFAQGNWLNQAAQHTSVSKIRNRVFWCLLLAMITI